jgi:DNA-binding transcriptional regulator YiaG
MPPAQFRSILTRLRLSQVEAARIFGVGERTARRWAAGTARVPHAVTLLLLLLADRKISLTDIEA